MTVIEGILVIVITIVITILLSVITVSIVTKKFEHNEQTQEIVAEINACKDIHELKEIVSTMSNKYPKVRLKDVQSAIDNKRSSFAPYKLNKPNRDTPNSNSDWLNRDL